MFTRLDPIIHKRNRRAPIVPHWRFDLAAWLQRGKKWTGADLREMNAKNGVGKRFLPRTFVDRILVGDDA